MDGGLSPHLTAIPLQTQLKELVACPTSDTVDSQVLEGPGLGGVRLHDNKQECYRCELMYLGLL